MTVTSHEVTVRSQKVAIRPLRTFPIKLICFDKTADSIHNAM